MKKLTKHILLSIPLIFCLNCTKTKDDTGKTDKKNDTNINSGNLRNDSLKNVPKKKDTIKETLKNQPKQKPSQALLIKISRSRICSFLNMNLLIKFLHFT